MSKYLLMAVFLCSAGVVTAQDSKTDLQKPISATTVDRLKEMMGLYAMGCIEHGQIEVEKILNQYRVPVENRSAAKHTAVFYIATCLSGADDTKASILVYDNPNTNIGLDPVPLDRPRFSRATLKIVGWTADIGIGSLSYDPSNKRLVRTIKDSSGIRTATYSLFETEAVLRKFEYDGTPDGKTNPKVIYRLLGPLILPH